ncbi:MAG: hypothetical protein GF398_11050 [Chitinivibrionales bacterium]|nr:hypothetical protein [Chitinivibrionales bacterium]
MFNNSGIVVKSHDAVPWQDYRASDEGMVVVYTSDPVSELPIREVPEELPSEIMPEPHYESGTFGFYGCSRTKIRSAFVKSKLRYIFFMTKYAGTRVEHRDEYFVTGYYHIARTYDVQRLHLRYLEDPACINADACIALRADEYAFVSLDDALAVNNEVLEEWEHTSKLTKQSRIMLDDAKTSSLLDYLKSKENIIDTYIEETARLSPVEEEEDEDEDGGE